MNSFLKDFLTNNLMFCYQPIFDKNKKIFCYEVLSRIIYNGKIYYPDSFINIFKNKTLEHQIFSEIVIKKQLELIEKFNIDKKLNINLTFSDLKNKKIIEYILNNKKYFNIEFLESETYNNKHINSLCRLKQKKITFFLDDLGSGKSIKNYFNDIFSAFPTILNMFDYIKLDKIFINKILENKYNFLRLEKIVDLIKLENKKIVAEWVENEKIFNYLKSLDIDYFQGYYFSKPVNAESIFQNKNI